MPDPDPPFPAPPGRDAASFEAPPGTAVLAFDPGLRIGVAWVAADGTLLRRAIVDAAALDLLPLPGSATLVTGDGTGSDALAERLAVRGRHPEPVDERGTTLRARRLWLADHPPRGWQRLLPPGMRHPPGPIDDYAAWAIARRHLEIDPSPGTVPDDGSA